MDAEQYSRLKSCVEAERESGPRSSYTQDPIEGIPLELVELGYLIPEWVGPIILLSVTPQGFQAVAH